jgi:hypothetical protein
MSEMSENMSYFAAFATALEMLEEFVFRQKVLSTNAALVLPFLFTGHCTREVSPNSRWVSLGNEAVKRTWGKVPC